MSRAFAAAMDPNEATWQFEGHGISQVNINDDPQLGDVILVDQRVGNGKLPGAFMALAMLLRSPTLPAKIKLRDIWMALPEGVRVPLQGAESSWSAAELRRIDGKNFWDVFATEPWRPLRPVARLTHLPYELAPLNLNDATALIREKYPSLKDFVLIWNGEVATIDFGWNHLDRSSLMLGYDPTGDPPEFGATGLDITRCGADGYTNIDDSSTWVPPVIGTNTQPLVPIISWWAVLYALLMLARYKPSNWTRMLDVDSSADAPAIEYLLSEAHRATMNLVLEVFELWEFREGHKMSNPSLKKAMERRRRKLKDHSKEYAEPLAMEPFYYEG